LSGRTFTRQSFLDDTPIPRATRAACVLRLGTRGCRRRR